jgi:hypothetical protein
MKNLTKDQLDHIITLSKFRVKIKSLAEESRIIRKEERKRRGLHHSEKWREYEWKMFASDRLSQHRREVVRPEQRATLLAYAFMRGKPYSTVERPGSVAPNIKRIQDILKSLTGSAQKYDINSWLLAEKVA